MLPSFLCLRRVMAHQAQKVLWFFSCCESSFAVQPEFTARSEKLKGQILHPLLLSEVVTQIYATLPSQKCRNVTSNPFYDSLFVLEDHIPESPFLPRLNRCSPVFFYSLNRQLIFMPHIKLTLRFCCPQAQPLPFHLVTSHRFSSPTQTLPSCASIQFSVVLCDFPKPNPWPQP